MLHKVNVYASVQKQKATTTKNNIDVIITEVITLTLLKNKVLPVLNLDYHLHSLLLLQLDHPVKKGPHSKTQKCGFWKGRGMVEGVPLAT